jgi:hypothetical protein
LVSKIEVWWDVVPGRMTKSFRRFERS